MAFNKAKAMHEAEKYVAQGKIAHAIKQYSSIFEKDPSDLNLLNTIGDLYYRDKNVPQALSHFQTLADAYTQEGFTVKAIAIYKKIIKLESGSAEPLLKLAELYMLQGLSREARDHFAQAVDFYKKKNQIDKAVEIFRKILALDPDNLNYRNRFADFCEQSGRKQEAAAAYVDAAEVALRRDDLGAAETALKKSAQLDAQNFRMHFLRARLALKQGKLDQVERILDSVPELKSSKEATQLLVESYSAGGRYEDAGKLLVESFRISPADFGPLAAYAVACGEKGDFDAAFQPLASAAETLIARKETGPLLDSLRRIWVKAPQHLPTLELIRRIYEATGDEFALPEVLQALGGAYVEAEELEKAEEIYRKLLSREPQNEQYRSRLNQVLEKQGKELEVGAILEAGLPVEEVEAPETGPPTAAPAPSPADAEEAAMVSEALENSDLFSRYNLVDKAVAELEKVLVVYPSQVDIHRRILEICHRSQPERARQAAGALARIYSERGDVGSAQKYKATVGQIGGAAPAEEVAVPEFAPETPEVTAPPAAEAPEPAPPEVDLSAVFPVGAPKQPSVEEPTSVPAELAAAAPAKEEVDLSADFETFARVTETPVAPPEVPPLNYEDSQVEINFYLDQGLFEEASRAVEALEEKYPGNSRVAEFRRLVEARTAGAEVAAEAPAVGGPGGVGGAEWELPTSFAGPAPVEAPPPPEVTQPAPEPAAAGGDLLGELAGDLAASLGGFQEPTAPPSQVAGAGRQPGIAPTEAGGESPLSGLLEELGEGAEAEAAKEDPETHYNLGVAFREMNLLDEAIGEFQKVVKGAQKGKYPPNFLQACSLLATCFMDKGMPSIAAKWYARALEMPGLDEEAALALQYDLGVAYEKAGDTRTALEKFSEVYAQNIDYRDVAEKIRQLQQRGR